jgi:hypothetical protein
VNSGRPVLINKPSASYIKAQLDSGDPVRTKQALQELCSLYRRGYRLDPTSLLGVEQTIIGILYTTGRTDEKVRRWALIALAQFGRLIHCERPIMDTLAAFHDQPQTAAAAVAAIFRMEPDLAKATAALGGVDPQIVTLASLQSAPINGRKMPGIPIDIDGATSDSLMLGLVAVGLDRAPPNLFHPRHNNPSIVKALGTHHDPLVSQYSIWAVAENQTLALSDLGIPLDSIESRAPNVRGWMFRAMAMDPNWAAANNHYIAFGAGDPEREPRFGLASGLRDSYFDGVDPIVNDWFFKEGEADVRDALLDHMIRQSEQCPAYASLAREIYQTAAAPARHRMEAHAAGLALYGEFKRLSFSDGDGLFGGLLVTNNNFYGNISAGAFSGSGDAKTTHSTINHYNEETKAGIQAELAKVLAEVHQLAIDETVRAEAVAATRTAQADPTPDNLRKVLAFLEKVDAIAGKGAAVAGKVSVLAGYIATIGRLCGLG